MSSIRRAVSSQANGVVSHGPVTEKGKPRPPLHAIRVTSPGGQTRITGVFSPAPTPATCTIYEGRLPRSSPRRLPGTGPKNARTKPLYLFLMSRELVKICVAVSPGVKAGVFDAPGEWTIVAKGFSVPCQHVSHARNPAQAFSRGIHRKAAAAARRRRKFQRQTEICCTRGPTLLCVTGYTCEFQYARFSRVQKP